MSSGRSAWPSSSLGDVAQPDLESLRRACAATLSDYKAPDALAVVDELPLTPMMKVDPAALAALAELAAAERRSDLDACWGARSQVLGSGPTGEAHPKEPA